MQRASRLTSFGILAALCMPAFAQHLASLDELADLTLEQLANVTVTSASRRAEALIDAPASIFVVSAEDIRRSGATTLADALALAPNLHVVRGDSSQAIASARGGLFGTANKMLVLIDGRIVYTPLFAGVFSDAQDLFIEDIERIEVISGPGSTLWGTNAVNGVINVTTKRASTTQGTLVTVLGGADRREVGVRQGGRFSPDGAWRFYAKYGRFEDHEIITGASARDAAERWQVGFRTDVDRGDRTQTIQGDAYGANVDNAGGPRDLAGGNLRGRWTWRTAQGGDFMVQGYYDRTERRHAGSFEEKRDTFDVEAQHALRHGDGRFVWGADYRVSTDRTVPSAALAFVPTGRALHFASLYAQEEYALARDLRATAGLRAERNDYTGVEWLPNLRLSWTHTPQSVFWAALTRSVRAPSRIDRDLVVPGAPPYVLAANDSFQGEVARVAELGWRRRLEAGAWISVTAFHHDFRRLRTLEPAGGGVQVANGGRGRTSGVEMWGDAFASRDFRLQAGMVLMRHRFEVEPGRVDLDQAGIGNNPRRTAMARASWNLPSRWEFDATVRHMGALPRPEVPPYTIVDLRLGWRPVRDLELALAVDNAFDKRHVEFGAPGQGAVFGRSVLLKATWTAF